MALNEGTRARLESQGYDRAMRGEAPNCLEDRLLDPKEAVDAREVGGARAREDRALANHVNKSSK